MMKRGDLIPPARPVSHLSTLWWWLGFVGVGVLLYEAPRLPTRAQASFARAEAPPPAPGHPSVARMANGDFLALMFGKVGTGPDALPPDTLRDQLQSLKSSGAHAVRVEDVQALVHRNQPLPARAVLLVFEDAGRETVDAAEPVLAALGWPALALVNVDGVAAANINLVSRRRLEQMTQGGHWSVGVSGCRENGGDFDAAAYRRRADALQGWTGQPVLAIGCGRWRGTADDLERWSTALMQAQLPLGFLPHATGLNRRGDSPWTLRVAHLGAGETEADALVRRAVALTPREQPFVDKFAAPELDENWVVASGQARIAKGKLSLGSEAGGTGVLTFAGAARWRDERITVALDAIPSGQFWIYARHGGQRSFVRLGTVGRQVVLQRSDDAGRTRQLAAMTIDPGPLRLSLSVIGGRATAAVGDRLLTDRPADVPADLVDGPPSLMVWSSGAQRATARIASVSLEPVARRLALLSAHPGDGSFERLRDIADDLWAVSPRRFRWQAGLGSEEAPDPAVEMLMGLHRVAVIPAVSLAQLPAGEEWIKLRAQLLQWADRPRFAGLNLALDRVEPADFAHLEDLRAALADLGKELVVTSADDTGDLETPAALTWFTGPRSSGFVLATQLRQGGAG